MKRNALVILKTGHILQNPCNRYGYAHRQQQPEQCLDKLHHSGKTHFKAQFGFHPAGIFRGQQVPKHVYIPFHDIASADFSVHARFAGMVDRHWPALFSWLRMMSCFDKEVQIQIFDI